MNECRLLSRIPGRETQRVQFMPGRALESKEQAMRYERFHFGLIGACTLVGAAIGGVLIGTDGTIEGALVGMMVGVMAATSILDTDAE